ITECPEFIFLVNHEIAVIVEINPASLNRQAESVAKKLKFCVMPDFASGVKCFGHYDLLIVGEIFSAS
ncbi:MAG: hypothetical protein EBT51_12550, partial [Flavobacteriaceae bacterium]|nr:hypothetical protein [Flavobacteriaceae bacterium]